MSGRILSIREVQEMLNISERTIFRLIKTGKLTGFKAGRQWRFEESDIQDFIKRQREEASQKNRDEVA